MQINQQKTEQVDVTEIRLHIKVSDGFAAGLQDAQGDEVGTYEGTCRISFQVTITATT